MKEEPQDHTEQINCEIDTRDSNNKEEQMRYDNNSRQRDTKTKQTPEEGEELSKHETIEEEEQDIHEDWNTLQDGVRTNNIHLY